jgi:hypothetical protein
VVLWATFEQRSIESDGVAWVHGPDLRHVLAQLNACDMARIAGALRRAVNST